MIVVAAVSSVINGTTSSSILGRKMDLRVKMDGAEVDQGITQASYTLCVLLKEVIWKI